MSRLVGRSSIVCALATAVLSGVGPVRSAEPVGAKVAELEKSSVALEGYCPVRILDKKEWIAGKADHAVEFDGRTFRCADAECAEKFRQEPTRYLPALGGDSVVSFAKDGSRKPGSIRHAYFLGGRLYLLRSAAELAAFEADPGNYAQADLAYAGSCAVGAVVDQKDVPATAKSTVVHNGIRYRFSSDAAREKFLAEPATYEVTSEAGRDATAKLFVSVKGRAACAVCDYRVSPLRDPDQLGMAVVDAQGRIFVLEEAHRRFPKLYADRFDRRTVVVTGKELKRSGNVVWLDPQHVEVVQ